MPNPWPPDPDLRSRLAAIGSPPRPPAVGGWQGTTYRFASRDFADLAKFTDGEGARRHGGRFTPVGGHRTVYLSLDRMTATAELGAWYEYYAIPDTAFQPRVFAAVGVCVGHLLDLTAPDALAELGLASDHVHDDWRGLSDRGAAAPVQVFGRLAFEAGFEGLRFPSARHPGGQNLALFPENFRPGSSAVMLNA